MILRIATKTDSISLINFLANSISDQGHNSTIELDLQDLIRSAASIVAIIKTTCWMSGDYLLTYAKSTSSPPTKQILIRACLACQSDLISNQFIVLGFMVSGWGVSSIIIFNTKDLLHPWFLY